jgi:hypothetical protein
MARDVTLGRPLDHADPFERRQLAFDHVTKRLFGGTWDASHTLQSKSESARRKVFGGNALGPAHEHAFV